MERKQVIRMIRWAFETNGPEQSSIRQMVQVLPQRTQEIMNGRIIGRKSWFRMEEEFFYSERRMRDILNAALDKIGLSIAEEFGSNCPCVL